LPRAWDPIEAEFRATARVRGEIPIAAATLAAVIVKFLVTVP
jgi:hypothetical protein